MHSALTIPVGPVPTTAMEGFAGIFVCLFMNIGAYSQQVQCWTRYNNSLKKQ
jgi:hypothetical protein